MPNHLPFDAPHRAGRKRSDLPEKYAQRPWSLRVRRSLTMNRPAGSPATVPCSVRGPRPWAKTCPSAIVVINACGAVVSRSVVFAVCVWVGDEASGAEAVGIEEQLVSVGQRLVAHAVLGHLAVDPERVEVVVGAVVGLATDGVDAVGVDRGEPRAVPVAVRRELERADRVLGLAAVLRIAVLDDLSRLGR